MQPPWCALAARFWWATFLESWNGVSLLAAGGHLVPDQVVVSDASGAWGCGAYWAHEWFQLEWAGTPVATASIAVKELVPLVLAVALWGSQWKGDTVMCRCDNEAVVAVITTRTAHDKGLMQLLRCLFFLEARFDCHLLASHIPGIHNELADHLSRNRASVFLQRAPPAMAPSPRQVRQDLRTLVLGLLDWTSAAWRRQFRDTFGRV